MVHSTYNVVTTGTFSRKEKIFKKVMGEADGSCQL